MKKTYLIFALLLLAGMSTVANAEDTPLLPPEPLVSVTQEDRLQDMPASGENAPVLKDVRIVSENGQQRIIKTWETSPGYDADQQPDFQKNGYNFKKSYLLMVSENQNNQFIRVICADGTVKEHRMVNNGYGCKLHVGVTDTDNHNIENEED